MDEDEDAMKLFLAPFVVAWRLLVVVTPLLGIWLASSTVAFFGGWRELSLAGGVLLFPILPLLWELRGQGAFRRRRARAADRGRPPPRQFLRFFDRLVLRTLIINLLFLVVLLGLTPKVAFVALATRGDWFLGGRTDEVSTSIRAGLVKAAGGLEWLHTWANPNPYTLDNDLDLGLDAKELDDVKPTDETAPTPEPVLKNPKVPTDPKDPKAPKVPKDPVPAVDPPTGADEATWQVGKTFWPHQANVHPAVVAMPPEVETDLTSVATYLKAKTQGSFDRVKALHDWTVTRLTYDMASVTGTRAPQDAATVFARRLGVCEGYARLMVAFGKVTGDRIVYVVGDIRERDGRAAPVGHAWNAVEIEGDWYLLDATWDDPTGGDASNAGASAPEPSKHPNASTKSKHSNYSTDYLFIPPSVAIFDHFPNESQWQLLAEPLSRTAFLRQPQARPGLAKAAMTLVTPQAPVVDAKGALTIALENPRQSHVMLRVGPDGGSAKPCSLADGANDVDIRASCDLPTTGRYQVILFLGKARFGTYDELLSITVNSR